MISSTPTAPTDELDPDRRKEGDFSNRFLNDFPHLKFISQCKCLNFSKNPISSFKNLPALPILQEIILDYTDIKNFEDAQPQPRLSSISLLNTPICQCPFLSLMCVIVFGNSVKEVNGKILEEIEINTGIQIRAQVISYITRGWLIYSYQPLCIFNSKTNEKKCLTQNCNVPPPILIPNQNCTPLPDIVDFPNFKFPTRADVSDTPTPTYPHNYFDSGESVSEQNSVHRGESSKGDARSRKSSSSKSSKRSRRKQKETTTAKNNKSRKKSKTKLASETNTFEASDDSSTTLVDTIIISSSTDHTSSDDGEKIPKPTFITHEQSKQTNMPSLDYSKRYKAPPVKKLVGQQNTDLLNTESLSPLSKMSPKTHSPHIQHNINQPAVFLSNAPPLIPIGLRMSSNNTLTRGNDSTYSSSNDGQVAYILPPKEEEVKKRKRKTKQRKHKKHGSKKSPPALDLPPSGGDSEPEPFVNRDEDVKERGVVQHRRLLQSDFESDSDYGTEISSPSTGGTLHSLSSFVSSDVSNFTDENSQSTNNSSANSNSSSTIKEEEEEKKEEKKHHHRHHHHHHHHDQKESKNNKKEKQENTEKENKDVPVLIRDFGTIKIEPAAPEPKKQKKKKQERRPSQPEEPEIPNTPFLDSPKKTTKRKRLRLKKKEPRTLAGKGKSSKVMNDTQTEIFETDDYDDDDPSYFKKVNFFKLIGIKPDSNDEYFSQDESNPVEEEEIIGPDEIVAELRKRGRDEFYKLRTVETSTLEEMDKYVSKYVREMLKRMNY